MVPMNASKNLMYVCLIHTTKISEYGIFSIGFSHLTVHIYPKEKWPKTNMHE